MTMQAGTRTLVFDWSCAVAGREDTAVAAGTFRAFRVDCRNTVGTHEVFWFSPELGNFVKMSVRRDASSPFGVGTQDTELTGYKPGR
jgi:hypothetical protein